MKTPVAKLYRTLSLLFVTSFYHGVSSFHPSALYSGTMGTRRTTRYKTNVLERTTGRQRMREISPLSFLSTSLSLVLNEDAVVGAGGSANSNRITIEYCTGCRWMLRSAWLMQELFTTFYSTDEIRSITLVPSKPPSPGGTFVSIMYIYICICYFCSFMWAFVPPRTWYI